MIWKEEWKDESEVNGYNTNEEDDHDDVEEKEHDEDIYIEVLCLAKGFYTLVTNKRWASM